MANPANPRDFPFAVRQEFRDINVIRTKNVEYNCRLNTRTRTKVSSPVRFEVVCVHRDTLGCPYRVRADGRSGRGLVIMEAVGTHTCLGATPPPHSQRGVTTVLSAAIQDQPGLASLRPFLLAKELQRQTGIDCSEENAKAALRSARRALGLHRGSSHSQVIAELDYTQPSDPVMVLDVQGVPGSLDSRLESPGPQGPDGDDVVVAQMDDSCLELECDPVEVRSRSQGGTLRLTTQGLDSAGTSGSDGQDVVPPHNLPNGDPDGNLLTSLAPTAGRREEGLLVPQWSYHETKELISLRGELEEDLSQTKGNSKTMWNIISAQMKEGGYRRTPAQCKAKWKELVNRFKGKGASDEGDKLIQPFRAEIDAIFNKRAKNMSRLLESEAGDQDQVADIATAGQCNSIPRKRARMDDPNTVEEEEVEEAEEGEEGDEEEEVCGCMGSNRRRLLCCEALLRENANNVQGVLEQFFVLQMKLEQEWREAIERRAAERREWEKELGKRMEAFEKERMAREEAWHRREEERRAREELRAERRDRLITALLARLA